MTALRIANIRRDGGTQPRAKLNSKTVADYANLYRDGTDLGPVDVIYDGTNHWLVNGYHRLAALESLGRTIVTATVSPGTLRDAKLAAARANCDQLGQRRTEEDVRRAIMIFLEDSEWASQSNGHIAAQVGASESTVRRLRATLTSSSDEVTIPPQRTYTNKHGQTAVMNTGKIGKPKPAAAPKLPDKAAPSEPPTSKVANLQWLREQQVAHAAPAPSQPSPSGLSEEECFHLSWLRDWARSRGQWTNIWLFLKLPADWR